MLGHWDWLVVAVYGAFLVTVGVSTARRHPRAEDYFLASRGSHWRAIGLALLASNASSTALIGLAGAAYATGISVYDYEWSATVILVVFCLFLLPFVMRSQVYTMPEFLERRYDARARLYFALLTLFLNVFVDSAGALYSGSLVCQMLLPAVPLIADRRGTGRRGRPVHHRGRPARSHLHREHCKASVLMLRCRRDGLRGLSPCRRLARCDDPG